MDCCDIWATLDASAFIKCLFFSHSFPIQRRPHKQQQKLYKNHDMRNDGRHVHFRMIIMIIPHLTDWYFEFRTDESQPVPGVESGSQSTSGRPADSRGDRRRSGRVRSPRRSLHASLLVTSLSCRRGKSDWVHRSRQRRLERRNGEEKAKNCYRKQIHNSQWLVSLFCCILSYLIALKHVSSASGSVSLFQACVDV